jgi:hypothetical protein
MNSYKIDPHQTGWLSIQGGTKIIVAHFKDGHKENMELVEFLTCGRRKLKNIIQIDCYAEGEEIAE